MSALLKEPEAREKKPLFSDLPPAMLRQIEDMVGDKIASSDVAFGGLSSSAGFIMTLQSGRRVFAKGTHPGELSHGAKNLGQEVMAYETLDILRAVAPPYIGVVSDGDEDGWMLGIWDFVPHDPNLASAQRVMEVMKRWQADREAQGILPPARKQVYIDQFFTGDKKWLRLRHDEGVRKKFLSMFAQPSLAGKWFEHNMVALCQWQARVEKMETAEGLLHGDLRLDNFLFALERSFAVDWPNACWGPLALDLVFIFSNMEAMGYGQTEKLFDEYAQTGGAAIDPDDRAVMLTAVSGYFADQAYREVPEKLPRLRWMQKSMLLAQLKCMARLGIIESPPQMNGENA
ncbi:MAG: phosphotransferase [Alphaproteobacteria bacterium]|nr:phosphotransferase [Alphaproteobacteria bacterium]